MKILLIAAAGLALAGAAQAQDPDADQAAAHALTDDLNAPPPSARVQSPPQQPAAQTPVQPIPQGSPPPPIPRVQPASATAQPSPTPSTTPERTTPDTPVSSPPTQQPAPSTRQPAAPTPPATEEASPTAAPQASAVTTSAPAAPTAAPPQPVAAESLPFRITLPTGFSVFRTARGDVATYTVRKGDAAYLMVFVGPQSQFPIYDGRLVERGGRSSMIITEDGQDRAVEHLFRDPNSRVETHVLVSTVADDQRAVADAIAQSVDPK